MKKNYFLGLALMSTTLAFGQVSYDLQIQLTSPAPSASVAPVALQSIDFSITNNGPDAVPGGDTLFLSILAFGSNFVLDVDAEGNNEAGASIIPLAFQGQPAPLPSGTTISTAQLGGPATINTSSVATGTQQVCVFGTVGVDAFTSQTGDPRDTDMTNNISCFTVNAALANFVELTLADVLTIISKDGSIEINSANADVLEYTVYGLNGQSVANGKFYSSTSVSTSEMPSGVYLVAVTNGNEVEVQKVFVR